jgi:hypothetical protein
VAAFGALGEDAAQPSAAPAANDLAGPDAAQASAAPAEDEQAGTDGEPEAAMPVEEDASVPVPTPPPWAKGVEWDTASFNRQIFAIWSADSEGIGASLRKLPQAYNQRLPKAQANLLFFLQGEMAKPGGQSCAVLRLAPKGQPSDSVEAVSWLPPAWKAEDLVPEALRTFGAPWLLAGQPGSVRLGTAGWALPGIGQFINCIAGSVILVTYPFKAALERGATINTATEWLLNMNLSTFKTFARPVLQTPTVQAACLTAGCTAWVPYGWAPILVTKVDQAEPSIVLSTPYMSATLAREYPQVALLATSCSANIELQASKGIAPWRELCQQFKEWASGLIGDPMQAVSPVAQVAKAIMDNADKDNKAKDTQAGQ